MAVAWTPHRFSGGTLALDATNTVVHRGDAARMFDRLEDPAEIVRFAEAAEALRFEELEGRRLVVADAGASHGTVLAIREATDTLFRDAATSGRIQPSLLPPLLRACADGLERPASAGIGPGLVEFETALARSALDMLAGPTVGRIRICPNCRWLFLDRSRNRSRLWCDMTVCGNRAKARRHYRRRRANGKEDDDE